MFRPALIATVALASFVPTTAAHAQIITPEAHLGHAVGADRKLADWSQIVSYFDLLDRGSPRIDVQRLGKSTLGREFIMAVISSEANVRDAERYRGIARRLADPRGLSKAEANQLIADGKAIVLVTCNIHAIEIGSSQMAMEWAHQLVTATDAKTTAWLDDVILLLMPSINPDGTDMIVDWYREKAGTKWEGGRLPWLYHHYAGHDNNRDWYMLNLVETRMVNRVLFHDWFPQVFLDEHQMGSTSPRIFVPPYSDPHSRSVHPMELRLVDLIGTHMALRLEQAGKKGVISSYAFDAYWPGGTKNTAAMKNVIGLLSEVASCRIASPVYVDPNELGARARKGLPEYQPQTNFPNPWPGGWWHLRDIVDYELILSNSLIETCSRFRADVLRAYYEMGVDAVRGRRPDAPVAYVIPRTQHDPASASAMVEILREHGLEAHTLARDYVNDAGQAFEAGSVVLRTDQPYRPFLVEMMERQRYPEIREGIGSDAAIRPYDVTAWTLPLLMGVQWERAAILDAELAAFGNPWTAPDVSGWPGEGVKGYLIDPASNDAYRLVNALLDAGVRVDRVVEPFEVVDVQHAAGHFYVGLKDHEAVARLAAQHKARVLPYHWDVPAPRKQIRKPRIGLYKPWRASMDEGWTRLVLDRFGFAYTNLDNAAMKRRGLRSRFDAIVLPSVNHKVIVDGAPESDSYDEPMPPPYDGGIDKEGVDNLKRFVEAGGTLVCLSESSGLPLEHFNLPVRDVTKGLARGALEVPGTLLNLNVDTTHPLGFGMPAEAVAYVTGGPAFSTWIPGANVGRSVAARYPDDERDLLASGWGDGLSHLEGRPAVVEAMLGKGRVVLFGPRVQHRGQTHATYKMLFNALYLGGMP